MTFCCSRPVYRARVLRTSPEFFFFFFFFFFFSFFFDDCYERLSIDGIIAAENSPRASETEICPSFARRAARQRERERERERERTFD